MVNITGTDDLKVGNVYVINISGTNQVWTVVNDDIYLRDYDSNNKQQLFKATLDSDNRWGFYSDAHGKRVNRNRYENVKCEDNYDTQGSWQCFVEIRQESSGKYKFYMTVYDNHRPLRKVSDSGGSYFTIQEKGDEVTIDFAIYLSYGLHIGLGVGMVRDNRKAIKNFRWTLHCSISNSKPSWHNLTLQMRRRQTLNTSRDSYSHAPSSARRDGSSPHSAAHQPENHLVSYPAKQRRPRVDKDAQDMVINSLRSQIQDLISQLELERTQHLSALNTGLLVEKSQVTAERTRLMEKATEEAAQRGQAGTARLAFEKDFDDLSASLFGQANYMVVEARYDKHLSERKVKHAEHALKSAEEARIQLMQAQSLAHSPYQDTFIAHLRILHQTSPNTPAMSTLLQLPFLSGLMTEAEDSEPTVRLDLAPSLNWLSRCSVLTAIHSGQLTFEPMSTAAFFAESTTHPASTTIAGINNSNDNIACALCGYQYSRHRTLLIPLVHPYIPRVMYTNHNLLHGAFFKKTNSGSNTQPSSLTTSSYRGHLGSHSSSQISIFRLASTSTSITSLPIPSVTRASSQPNSSAIPSSLASSSSNSITSHSQSRSQSSQPTTLYPLCMSGWCLHRLRTTCTLWAFARTGIVDKIWEEEVPPPPPPAVHYSCGERREWRQTTCTAEEEGGWGIASAIGKRCAILRSARRSLFSRTQGDCRLRSRLAARPSPILPLFPKRKEGRGRTAVAHAPPSPPPRAITEHTTAAEADTNASIPAHADAPHPLHGHLQSCRLYLLGTVTKRTLPNLHQQTCLSSLLGDKVGTATEKEKKKVYAVPPVPDWSTQPLPVSNVFVDAPVPGEEVEDPIAAKKVGGEEEEEIKEGDSAEKRDDKGDDKWADIDSPVTAIQASLPATEQDASETLFNADMKEEAVEREANEANDVKEKEKEAEESTPPKKTAEEKMEEEKRWGEKEEWEKANYVGDAKWGEQTWKEITRLRENISWGSRWWDKTVADYHYLFRIPEFALKDASLCFVVQLSTHIIFKFDHWLYGVFAINSACLFTNSPISSSISFTGKPGAGCSGTSIRSQYSENELLGRRPARWLRRSARSLVEEPTIVFFGDK
ncbi:LOW QUALITY PROTEIN: hypothetical protein CVT25_002562 [Psilocybe cyanescens]|uniref:GDP/GTP exchange factor Sec2 N-terminal domain-containing protein n=1 Tax=Psilocybe cyanescens TaxID=93625 RepID=A0A409WLG6_PSICY|nr:LOW QUALITY PROTEIN: hypothetical protein CVT25_002562 [Psilocybe cyanescens]